MCIIIIDDSPTNLIVLKRLAGAAKRPVQTFSSSRSAGLFLTTNCADLVIVDCEMPDMNGIELIAAIRTNIHHARTPIVMVTRHSDAELRKQALRAGATDFISKPVDPLEFRVRVTNLLRLTRGEAALSA